MSGDGFSGVGGGVCGDCGGPLQTRRPPLDFRLQGIVWTPITHHSDEPAGAAVLTCCFSGDAVKSPRRLGPLDVHQASNSFIRYLLQRPIMCRLFFVYYPSCNHTVLSTIVFCSTRISLARGNLNADVACSCGDREDIVIRAIKCIDNQCDD